MLVVFDVHADVELVGETLASARAFNGARE